MSTNYEKTISHKLKLSFKEKNLIRLLRQDSRQPINKLAKELKCSREMIHYILNKLMKRNILDFFTAIDFNRINYKCHYVLIKLKNNSDNQIKIINKKIKQVPGIFWVSTGIFSNMDLFLQIVSKDVYDYDKVYSQLKSILKDNLQKIISLQRLYIRFTPFLCIYTNKEMRSIKIEYKKYPTTLFNDITKTDLAVLNYFSNNSTRAPIREIANNLAISSNSIKKSLTKLKNNSIIGFNVAFLIGENALEGLNTYLALISFVEDDEIKKKQFEDYLYTQPSVSVFHRFVGSKYDYMVHISFCHATNAREFISKLVEKFPKNLEICDLLVKGNMSPAQKELSKVRTIKNIFLE